jgi:excisionase family DNA binding protein
MATPVATEETAQPKQPLLTTPQVARQLNVTAACIRRMVREHRLNSIKIGRTVRFDPAYIAEYIGANTRPARKA